MRHPLFLGFFFGAANCFAGPVGLVNLHNLAAGADAIVVGSVLQGQQSGQTVSLSLSADRVLKGSIATGNVMSVQWTSPTPLTGTRELKGVFGLFFLGKLQTGEWELLPTMAGDVLFDFSILPASTTLSSPDVQYTAAAAVDEKLLLELAAAIEGGSGSGLTVNYLEGLIVSPSLAATKVYERFTESTVPSIRTYGFAALIAQGDSGAITQLPKILPLLASGSLRDALVNRICAISNANPVAVTGLGALATSSTTIPRAKSCAVTALRQMHTKETLIYMDALLDSADPDIRYQAMAGLASFANSGSIPNESLLLVDNVVVPRRPSAYKDSTTMANFPTMGIFHENEGKYIIFWKNWWSNVGSALPR